MRLFFLVFVALSLSVVAPACAQRPDTTIIIYAGQLTGAYSAGGVNRTLISTMHNVTFSRGEHFGLPINGSYIYGKQNRLLQERELLLNTTPYYWKGRFRAYAIGSFESSNLRGIDRRIQVGAGPGWAFYTDSLKREVSLSNLFIRDVTHYQDGSSRLTARSSARLKVAWTQKILTLSSISFYQPSLADYGDYRFSNLSTLALKLTKKLAVNFTYNYTYESRVIENKPNDNTNITVGLSFTTK